MRFNWSFIRVLLLLLLRHVLVFYPLCALITAIFRYDYALRSMDLEGTAALVLWSPLYGFCGLYDRFPFFVLIPFLLFLVPVRWDIRVRYGLSFVSAYGVLFCLIPRPWEVAYYAVPSLAVALAVNMVWLRSRRAMFP